MLRWKCYQFFIMKDTAQNNKRIAKNTLLLYMRMLFMMAVSLYTSRVVLHTLGIENYGIYNVVGGVVAMFSMISGSLSTAISRFITFELGHGDKSRLIRIFSSSVTIQIGLGFIIVVLAELVGVWFLNCKMNIPDSRMFAANWVFQLSILTFIINLISVPYNAAIIAHEKMSAFAYISILEVVAKLVIVYLLIISPIDKLIFYAVLMASVALMVRFVYGYYCKRHFEECTYHFIFDKDLLKKMFAFAGWNFIGSSAGVLRDQGLNLLLNLFFNPIVNAARGISVQVNNAISSFCSNFLTAVNPQIIKSYSENDLDRSYSLVMKASKFSYLLLSILSVPIICETEFVLKLWLNTIPDHCVNFVRLTLILTTVESLSLPLITLQQATGRMKQYQITVGVLHLMNFPFSYLFLKLGMMPEIIYFIAIGLTIISMYARLFIQQKQLNISMIYYHREVLLRVVLNTIVMGLIIVFVRYYISNPLVGIILAFISTCMITLLIGLNKKELEFIYNKIKHRL